MTRITLYQGDVLQILQQLPAESVHMVCTSPPYWGLRDYGTEPQIWGGEPRCRHEWGGMQKSPWADKCPGPNGLQKNTLAGHFKPKQTGPFCRLCGAWLGSYGLEPTIEMYVEHTVQIFREVRRVVRSDGTLFLNLGDSYNGSGGAGGDYNSGGLKEGQPKFPGRHVGSLKPKNLCGVPWRVALALQSGFSQCQNCGLEMRSDLWPVWQGHKVCLNCHSRGQKNIIVQSEPGWWLRRDIIWSKPNPMPESCTDRPTTAHEYIFLLTKSANYFWDGEAVREDSCTTRPELLLFGPRPEIGFPGHMQDRRRAKAPDGWASHAGGHGSFHKDGREKGKPGIIRHGRNLRSVWTVNDLQGQFLKFCLSRGIDFDAMLQEFMAAQELLKDVWTLPTHPLKEAHFATFPPAIPERCIKAGTSDKGCCPKCGAPWKRVVEKKFVPQEDVSLEKGIKGAGNQKPMDASSSWDGVPRGSNQVATVGWTPTCGCCIVDSEAIPCTVLDPFSGAGTTALVAAKLQRDAIAIELNPEYVEMSRRRITGELGMLAEVEVKTP